MLGRPARRSEPRGTRQRAAVHQVDLRVAKPVRETEHPGLGRARGTRRERERSRAAGHATCPSHGKTRRGVGARPQVAREKRSRQHGSDGKRRRVDQGRHPKGADRRGGAAPDRGVGGDRPARALAWEPSASNAATNVIRMSSSSSTCYRGGGAGRGGGVDDRASVRQLSASTGRRAARRSRVLSLCLCYEQESQPSPRPYAGAPFRGVNAVGRPALSPLPSLERLRARYRCSSVHNGQLLLLVVRIDTAEANTIFLQLHAVAQRLSRRARWTRGVLAPPLCHPLLATLLTTRPPRCTARHRFIAVSRSSQHIHRHFPARPKHTQQDRRSENQPIDAASHGPQ